MSKVENPSIYVACLAAYNNGLLHGVWIDVTFGIDHINREVKKMLKSSPISGAEEWAIHSDANFHGIAISESMDFEIVVEIAEFIENYGELGVELVEDQGLSLDDAQSMIEENYHGEYKSTIHFVEQLMEDELSKYPEHIRNYFNYDAFTYDLFITDYFEVRLNGKSHVFSHM